MMPLSITGVLVLKMESNSVIPSAVLPTDNATLPVGDTDSQASSSIHNDVHIPSDARDVSHCLSAEVEHDDITPAKKRRMSNEVNNGPAKRKPKPLSILPKGTRMIPCRAIIGETLPNRVISPQTKERATAMCPNVRVVHNHWDVQLGGFIFAMDMAKTSCRPNDLPLTISKFRLFTRAFELRLIGWGQNLMDTASHIPDECASTLSDCLSISFPIAPTDIHQTLGMFQEYFQTRMMSDHTVPVIDVSKCIQNACSGIYYIVHYCMVMGIPAFLVSLYLLDVFGAGGGFNEVHAGVLAVSQSPLLDNYADWCMNHSSMTGHYKEPVLAYSVIIRVVDVMSLCVNESSPGWSNALIGSVCKYLFISMFTHTSLSCPAKGDQVVYYLNKLMHTCP